MAAVGLLFVGGVLFVNAIMLLGKADPKSVGTFNIFVGALQVVVPFYLIATAKAPDDILLTAGIFLFGFTYLYVGITNLAGHESLGLGWYCLWVVFMAIAFSLINFVKFGDVKFGIIWLHWAALWALFWLVLAMGRERLTPFTGWVTLVMSFTTCTFPALLILLGAWDPLAAGVVIGVTIAEVVLFAAIAPRTTRGTRETFGGEPRAGGAQPAT